MPGHIVISTQIQKFISCSSGELLDEASLLHLHLLLVDALTEGAHAVHEVVLPVTVVGFTGFPSEDSIAIAFIVLPIAFILVAILELVESTPRTHSMTELSLIFPGA